MNRKKKENIFYLFMEKGNFSFITKKKKTFFLEEQMFIIYRYFFFFWGKEREGVYFKLKYLLPYLQFFFFYFMQKHFW